MNVHALARRMIELNTWLESLEAPDIERHEFDRAPFGRAHLTLDPSSTARAASLNRNRVCLCGADGGLTRDGLAELSAKFTARGIDRFFVWLSPGPRDAEVREWLEAMSFTRVKWTRYPTLLAEPAVQPRGQTFDIRRIDVEDFNAARAALDSAAMEGYVRTLGVLAD